MKSQVTSLIFAVQTFDADDVRNGSPKNLHLKLHRGQVFTELIDYIMKSDIIKENSNSEFVSCSGNGFT